MSRRTLVVLAAVAAPLLAACTQSAEPAAEGNPRSIIVSASDDACEVSAAEAPAGRVTFTVTNTGSQVNEFYLLGDDGARILGEVENIGPGVARQLVVTLPVGRYETACKPGMTGDGLRAGFTVTGSDGR